MAQIPSFRQLDQLGAGELVQMAAREGWNPGIHDAKTFYRVDPNAFLGAFENDQFVGGGAIVQHDSKFGFMGLFIVHPEFRGAGVGRKLWIARRDRLIERLDEDASIGMDGVVTMVPFYAKGGFRPYYLSSRYQVRGFDSECSDSIRTLTINDFEEIATLDRSCFPSNRDSYLRAWIEQPDAVVAGIGTELEGYGVLRPCKEGFKIGPLFAASLDAAEELLRFFLSQAKGNLVSIDVPEPNHRAVKLCQSLGMEKVFECQRMYWGTRPEYEVNWIYGLTSFELG